jgi:hypothetical protein
MSVIRLDWKNGTLWYNGARFSPEEILEEERAIPFDMVDLGVKCETDACRKLLELGLAFETDSILTYREDMSCFRCGVKWGSKRVVTTNSGGTPIFAKFNPVVKPRTGEGRGRRPLQGSRDNDSQNE